MARFIKRIGKKLGKPAGSAVYLGEKEPASSKVLCTLFDEKGHEEIELQTLIDAQPLLNSDKKLWIQVEGLSHLTIEEIGKALDIHPLFLEDILNTDHRPKADELDESLFVVLKALSVHEEDEVLELESEHICILLGSNFAISFQEGRSPNLFKPISKRIQSGRGRIRQSGPDYLFYTLIDAVIDSYFPVVERLGSEIESLQPRVEDDSDDPDIPSELSHLKIECLFLRKHLIPAREAVSQIIRNPPVDMSEKTLVYLKDAQEHAIHLVDAVDHYREMLSHFQQLFMANANYRMTEVMKVLTIFAALFIPLTFVVGLYGMNFDNIPELRWQNGYYYVWGLMIFIAGSLLYYFKRKKWI